jgi:ribosomal protein L32E
MSLFNIVHILKLVIFENMLAYKNVKSYMLSITYGFEQNLSVRGQHPSNWNMVYIWATTKLLK